MTEASAIMIPEASALTVDTSVIDVSEVESQEDKDFLLEKGENILRIVARAAIEVGEQLHQIQEKFRKEGNNGAGLAKFYSSIGISKIQASTWTRCYKGYLDYVRIFGEEGAAEVISGCAETVVAKIQSLPSTLKESYLADLWAGNPPTKEVIEAEHAKPTTKLSKVEELKAAALEKKKGALSGREEAKEAYGSDSPEYTKANDRLQALNKQVKSFEQQVLDLQAEVEEEKLKTAKENEKNAKLETELQKLKFDDASIRADRVKRVSNQLLVQVPAVLKEVQTFYAEIEHYDANTRDFLEEQLNLLINYTKDHL